MVRKFGFWNLGLGSRNHREGVGVQGGGVGRVAISIWLSTVGRCGDWGAGVGSLRCDQ